VTPAATTSCDTSDLAMSTPSSGEDTTVYSTGTRAINPVTLRNTSSVDCPDSGFIVLLLPNPVSEPEPTLEWRIGGGSWHGTSLSWDNGVVNGNASCASPCWKAGIVTLDVPAHTTYTIDLAVIFHSGLNSEFFSGAIYYTGQAVTDDGASGALIAWAYINQAGSSTGNGGSGSGGSTPQHSPSTAASSRTAAPSHSPAASPKASASPTPSRTTTTATPTPTASTPSPATHAATPNLAPVADTHSGGSGPSTAIAATGMVVLALAAGAGYVLTRRRRAKEQR
jgi:cell division septation protein DedD